MHLNIIVAHPRKLWPVAMVVLAGNCVWTVLVFLGLRL